MLKIRIIPCLDVKEGRVVKGINFIDLKDAGDQLNKQKFMMNKVLTNCVFRYNS